MIIFFNKKKSFYGRLSLMWATLINSFILKNYLNLKKKKEKRVPTQVLVTRTLN